jgi:DNA-binding CsgD family transcriptional regulator
MALLTEAIATVGDARAAAVLYERLNPYASHYIVNAMSPNFYGAADHYLGMLAATMARWEAAVMHFESALLLNTRTRVPSHIAATQFEYAKALLAADRTLHRASERRVQELLDAALRSARALDMRRIVAQIEQLLRTNQRARSLGSGITVQATHHGDGLTPREAEVLRLVARGMSNREIATALVVTVNTVEVHLTRIYDKLGVRGRSSATAYALRHGLD